MDISVCLRYSNANTPIGPNYYYSLFKDALYRFYNKLHFSRFISSFNKICWLCLVPTSTTRCFASDVG